jgi:integrase/recombinase XerD
MMDRACPYIPMPAHQEVGPVAAAAAVPRPVLSPNLASRPRAYKVTLERDPSGAVRRARVGIALVDAWLEYLAAVGRATTTWSSYAYDLAVFCRWLAAQHPDHSIEEALRGLRPAEVFAFVEHQLVEPRQASPVPGAPGETGSTRPARPLGIQTVYRRVVALAKFFDWAEAAGEVDRNPVPRERPRQLGHRPGAGRPAFLRVPAPLPRPSPTTEVVAFAATLRTWRDRALFALLVGAGLRLSEALGLRLGDLDWGGRQVFVRRGKGGRQRYAMAPDAAWAALKAYLEAEWPEPDPAALAAAATAAADLPVFVVLHGPGRGRRLTAAGVQSVFRHHRRRAGTPNVTPHRLRHRCGTDLHQAGMALEFLQEQLGHRRLESTRLYVHLSNERLRAAYLAVQPHLYVGETGGAATVLSTPLPTSPARPTLPSSAAVSVPSTVSAPAALPGAAGQEVR